MGDGSADFALARTSVTALSATHRYIPVTSNYPLVASIGTPPAESPTASAPTSAWSRARSTMAGAVGPGVSGTVVFQAIPAVESPGPSPWN